MFSLDPAGVKLDIWLTEPMLNTVQAPKVVGLVSGGKRMSAANTYRTVPDCSRRYH